MSKFIDLAGKKFGKLSVVAYLGQSSWECTCECGMIVHVLAGNLTGDRTRSCGCLRSGQSTRGRSGRSKGWKQIRDLAGEKFGRLLVIDFAGLEKRKFATWNCVCDCGTPIAVRASALTTGNTKSCGCLRGLMRRHLQDFEVGTYNSWVAMNVRCKRKSAHNYANYGGRGITVCERWSSFDNFLEDMGQRPEGHSIDRIDNNGNYEPGNCKWSTMKEQQNNRRNNRK